MRFRSAFIIALSITTSPFAALADNVPLTEESIDSADFIGWQARHHEAEAVAAAAKADTTTPPVEEKAPGEASDQVPLTEQPAEDAAARGVDSSDAPEVEVTGEPDKTVATPAYSTDVPDQAGLESADQQEYADPFLIRLQVLLDRAHASPGVIDGFEGDNTMKSIAAYEAMRKLPVDGKVDADLWTILAVDQGKAMMTYKITEEDVKGRYVESIPDDYSELAKMKWLGYHDVAEMLAEKFHMDETLLKTLNPNADLARAGTQILVADTGEAPQTKVARIVVDKARGELIAYDEKGAIVLSDPATIGSQDTPSPTGTVKVKSIAPDPTYSYDPSKNFKQGKNEGPLTIPPGPNGPVGSMWIDLSKPTYGIHGTPYPDKIDKSASHGCVRLTNWDAQALSKLVIPEKTVVEFKE